LRTKIYLSIANRIDGARLATPARRKWWWRLCRLLRPTGTIPIPLPFGRLWVDSRDGVVAYQLMKRGSWEPRETERLLELVRPGQRVVEIGANIGYHTVQLARAAGAAGRVHAFEPDPTNRGILLRNVAEHRLESIVDVHAAAVSDREGRAALVRHGHNMGGHSLIASNVDSAVETVSVATATLDDILAHETVDLIKIDAEGAEPAILAGARQTIARERPILFMEIWPYGLREQGGAVALLDGLRPNYSLLRIDEKTGAISDVGSYDPSHDEQDPEIAWTLLARPLVSAASPR
jgi:FkbM family methyltransferase